MKAFTPENCWKKATPQPTAVRLQDLRRKRSSQSRISSFRPLAPGCRFCCARCWKLTSATIPWNSACTRSSVLGRPRSFVKLLRQSSWRLARASQRGEYGKKWIPAPRRVAVTICSPKGSRKDASLGRWRVPNVIQNAMTTPDVMDIDSRTRSVPRRFGGEISEMYSGAPWREEVSYRRCASRAVGRVPWPMCQRQRLQ